jgi:hypothetical protein
VAAQQHADAGRLRVSEIGRFGHTIEETAALALRPHSGVAPHSLLPYGRCPGGVLLPRGLLALGEYRPTTHEVFRFQNVVPLLKAP